MTPVIAENAVVMTMKKAIIHVIAVLIRCLPDQVADTGGVRRSEW
jgi:hypothetical protein